MTQQNATDVRAQIADRFDAWAAGLKTLDPETMADLYAPDAVLIPTVSNIVRRDRAGLVDYFTRFLAKAPEVRIHDATIRVYGDIAIHSGVYLFNLTREAGAADVPARFTFVLRRADDSWRIIEHHSSYMPERGAY